MSCIAKKLGFKSPHKGTIAPRKFIRPTDGVSWIVMDWCEGHFNENKDTSNA